MDAVSPDAGHSASKAAAEETESIEISSLSIEEGRTPDGTSVDVANSSSSSSSSNNAQIPASPPPPPSSANAGAIGSGAAANDVVVKCAMVGDLRVGKTTLMVKYVEGRLDEDYIQTLGVVPMSKTIRLRNTDVTFSIWDLGGQREFLSMLPLVVNDAAALFFCFDLTRPSTLSSVKEWHRNARELNPRAAAFLVGTKFDEFLNQSAAQREQVESKARSYAKKMKAKALVFTSSTHSVNVNSLFKVVLATVFNLKCTLPSIDTPGEPLLIYHS